MALYNGSEKFSSQIGIAQYADVTDLMKHMTIEVGDVGQVMLPLNENENKRRYLNGQAILQEQFPKFTAKLKNAVSLYPSIACTEVEWQAIRRADPDDQCAKFVIDDVNGIIRLPRIKYLVGNLNLYKMGDGIPQRRLVKTYKNGTQWYNWYSDGWCEQGGKTAYISNTNTTVNLMIPYLDTNYFPSAIMIEDAQYAYADKFVSVRAHSATQIVLAERYISGNTTRAALWKTEGYASIPDSNQQYSQGIQNEFESPYYIQVSTGVDYEVDVVNHITTNSPYSFGMIQRTNNKLNNMSWLQSDGTFHSGNSYPDFYQWLLREKNNPESDITVKFSTDSDITEYDYVINTSDSTFKLPTLTGDETVQSQEFLDLTSQHYTVAGTGTTYTAPYNGYFYAVQRVTANASQYMGCYNDANYTHYEDYNNFTGAVIHLGPFFMERGQTMSDIRANVVGNDRVVRFFKAKSGYKYLYFYVGETMQDANLINVGRIVEAGAQLTTLVHLSEELGPMRTRYIVEKWENGTEYCYVYNDGWCVQGGRTNFMDWSTSGATQTITLRKEMQDTNYAVSGTMIAFTSNWHTPGCVTRVISTTQISVGVATAVNQNQGTAQCSWEVQGYMAQE